MSVMVTPEMFVAGYMRELRKKTESDWIQMKTTSRTIFTKEAAQTVIREAGPRLDSVLIPSKEYFRVDVIGEEKVGDKDCNWMLRVAFEHENDLRYYNGRPAWIQELCKLTHLFADLRVLAAYHNSEKDRDLEQLLQRNVDRMQSIESRMTRVPNGQWLFIFGPNSRSINGFRSFKLGGNNGTTMTELEISA
jgi:hypothetical protein